MRHRSEILHSLILINLIYLPFQLLQDNEHLKRLWSYSGREYKRQAVLSFYYQPQGKVMFSHVFVCPMVSPGVCLSSVPGRVYVHVWSIPEGVWYIVGVWSFPWSILGSDV